MEKANINTQSAEYLRGLHDAAQHAEDMATRHMERAKEFASSVSLANGLPGIETAMKHIRDNLTCAFFASELSSSISKLTTPRT